MTTRIPHTCSELRRLYLDEGLGVKAVGAYFGCSAPTVSNWLRQCGIPTRTGRFRAREVPRAMLEQLYNDEGLPLHAIAARMGVSIGTVNNRLRAYGIPRRRWRGGAGGGG